jgi:ribosomal protein S21
MKHKKEIYEKMKRRDFGESMSDETKLKVLEFIERQLRLTATGMESVFYGFETLK